MNIRLAAVALAIAFTGTSIFAAIPLNPIGPKEKDAVAPPRPVPLAHTKPTDWPQSLEILKAAPPLSGVYYNAAMKSLIERGLVAPDVSQSLSSSSLAAIFTCGGFEARPLVTGISRGAELLRDRRAQYDQR